MLPSTCWRRKRIGPARMERDGLILEALRLGADSNGAFVDSARIR